MSDAPFVHRIKHLSELEGALPPLPDGRPRMERVALLDAARVAITPIAFGHPDLSNRRVAEHPHPGSWASTSYTAQSRAAMLLRGAVIRSNTGIVTIDGYVAADTLGHVPDHELGGERVDGGIAFTPTAASAQVPRAMHLLSGGYENYYHWMTDVLARVPLAEALAPGAMPIFGVFQQPFQTFSSALLDPAGTGRRGLAPNVSLGVDELTYVPTVSGFGFEPHPCMLAAFDRLRANAIASAGGIGPTNRRIYVSRLGNDRRALQNEAEVIAQVSRYGFEVVELDGMDVREQILLFAQASHVVAPHGAGLTNLLFCHPGTVVCELLPSHYVNWCFRRMASLRYLQYGCLVGETVGAWNLDWPHANGWTLELGQLVGLLETDLFQPVARPAEPAG